MLYHDGWHLLARTTRTHVLQIEFTTRCDLRCTYCALSQPTWHGKDLDLSQFNYDELIAAARQRKCKVLNLHGHGETTMLPNWVEHAQKAVDTGIGVTICSNFGHEHTKEETEVLARFKGITISLDTVDPDLFKRLRRGAKLETLLNNMGKLRFESSRISHYPTLTWCCVLSDQNWRGMMDFVKCGLSLGVRTFCICNLHLLSTPKGGTELKHVSSLPKEEALEAYNLLYDVQQYVKSRRALFDIKSGILDSIEDKYG